MARHSVCPWWIGYLLASPIRRLSHDPEKVVEPYVRAGMTVFEPGPGMGFFTLELARRVGESGRVIAVDLQSKMLSGLLKRLARRGLESRLETRLATEESMQVEDLARSVDFVLAFAVVHEMPSAARFFEQSAAVMKPGGKLLLAEPGGHVTAPEVEDEIADACRTGLKLVGHPAIRSSRTAEFVKPI